MRLAVVLACCRRCCSPPRVAHARARGRRRAAGRAALDGRLRGHGGRRPRADDGGGDPPLPGPPRAGRRRHRRPADAPRARPPRPAAASAAACCAGAGAAGTSAGSSSCSAATASPRARWTAGSARGPTPRCAASRPGRGSAPTGSPARRRSPGCASAPPRSPLIFAPPLADRPDGPLRPARRPLPHGHRLPGGRRARRSPPPAAAASRSRAGTPGGYGNLVIVAHRLGMTSYYAHLSRIAVGRGTCVVPGTRSAASAPRATRPARTCTSSCACAARPCAALRLMELRAYTDADFALTERLETDPRVVAHLGGPVDPGRLPRVHRIRLADPWWFVITEEPGGPAVGTIGIWETEPPASRSTRRAGPRPGAPGARDREPGPRAAARARPVRALAFERVHAFPADGQPGLQRALPQGRLEHVGEVDVEFAGRPLHCNHWVRGRQRLSAAATSAAARRPLRSAPSMRRAPLAGGVLPGEVHGAGGGGESSSSPARARGRRRGRRSPPTGRRPRW